MSDYGPGTVALVEAGCWASREIALRLPEGWAHVNGINVDGDGVISPVRRLVVIDPEDREAVARLWSLYDAHCRTQGDSRPARSLDPLIDALREYTELVTSKPAEPTGRYAEVQDSEGYVWFRDPVGFWRRTDSPGNYFCHSWESVPAVKVLSEGVSE